MSIITLNTRSLPDSAVTTAKIAADAVTDAKIADDVVGTEHLTAGEVDATALGADSVTAAKINNDIISGATALTAEPADTDEFLVSDAGTLKRIDYSLIKGGGRYSLINRTTISGGTTYIDLTDVMTDTFENYLLVGSELNFATDGADLHIQVITSGGVQTGGSDYNWTKMQRSSGSTSLDSGQSTASDVYRINIDGTGNASNETANFEVHIYDARATDKTTFFRGEQVSNNTGSSTILNLTAGRYLSNGAITGIRFKASSGNINSGALTFYGANG